MSGIALIIAMSSITIGSGVTEKILTQTGKVDQAQYLSIATTSGLAGTALVSFVTFVKHLSSLG